MSLGRRKIRIDDPSSWVFNRMADAYDARPAYPLALVDAVAGLAGGPGARIADVGAGIGHLALPLAARGFDVVAVEPAEVMLERLRWTAQQRGLGVRTVHAAAEDLPIDSGSLQMVVVADALHFMDRQLAAHEISRVLGRPAALAVMTCAFADTPFMRGVRDIMEDSAPRRPRGVAQALHQLSAITRIPLHGERDFHDEVPVDHPTLDRILRSISFIGPAMKPDLFAAFRARVHALSDRPVWGRTFSLRWGVRAGVQSPDAP